MIDFTLLAWRMQKKKKKNPISTPNVKFGFSSSSSRKFSFSRQHLPHVFLLSSTSSASPLLGPGGARSGPRWPAPALRARAAPSRPPAPARVSRTPWSTPPPRPSGRCFAFCAGPQCGCAHWAASGAGRAAVAAAAAAAWGVAWSRAWGCSSAGPPE